LACLVHTTTMSGFFALQKKGRVGGPQEWMARLH
jgi:hypothetical protein